MLCSIAFFLGISGFCPDETISAYADPTATYRLVEMEGGPVVFDADIAFPEEGRVTGRGPCNTFTAAQTQPYPWIEIGPVASTRIACPGLTDEATFFAALEGATLAEVAGGILILTVENDGLLVFEAR